MELDLAKNAKTNPKKIFSYMNSRTKLRPGIGKICKNPDDPKSDTTDNDRQKVKIFSKFFGDVQTKEPDGELPEFEPRNVEFPMADLIISQEKMLALDIS